MTRCALHRVALIAGLGSLLIAGSIRLDAQNKQSKGQDAAQQPTFRAGANFVRVDVYPTIKGAAVRDLTEIDFDILEDGVPQKIESFEYVNVRGAGPEAEQHEPSTVAEARQIAETTKGRLFVIPSDTVLRGRRRLASAATDAGQLPPPHPRPRRHVRGDDAGHVRPGHQLRAPDRHDRRVSLEGPVLGAARSALS